MQVTLKLGSCALHMTHCNWSVVNSNSVKWNFLLRLDWYTASSLTPLSSSPPLSWFSQQTQTGELLWGGIYGGHVQQPPVSPDQLDSPSLSRSSTPRLNLRFWPASACEAEWTAATCSSRRSHRTISPFLLFTCFPLRWFRPIQFLTQLMSLP